jgi:rare lipoprotein A
MFTRIITAILFLNLLGINNAKADLPREQHGIASVYSSMFEGRKMSNGQVFHLASNNAASLTLPLGTIARVTNLKTRKSCLVHISDHGPYVGGRIIDLTPATARSIGAPHGLTHVKVTPVGFEKPKKKSKKNSWFR